MFRTVCSVRRQEWTARITLGGALNSTVEGLAGVHWGVKAKLGVAWIPCVGET